MLAATSTGVPTTGTREVSGTFKIHGLYCKPTKKVKKNSDTLQLLVHGITYNGSMWEGWGFGDKYNWHAYANKQGYHTLAIDRLGHGLSTRAADPLNTVQGPMHVEIIHQLISTVRGNTSANLLGKGFSKIAYKSAAIHDPTRFPGVPYGYLTFPEESIRTAIMYGGAFDPAIAAFDFAHTDSCTIGEVGTNPWILQGSPGHTTPVMTTVGSKDVVFCPDGKAACEAVLAETQNVFPDSPHYEYYVPDNTAHDLTVHYSAPKTFKKAHEFLDRWL
ncbi:hypothetical protein B0T14DRAFT_532939 [Immersiella caudata]|uniref:Uncharacterized protein n=1 Tax=Immersiella caudata TaxID=314043 RepID=A0AA40CCL8_9PEZI|nr:hypothetical protein B0T14DRAFT_532939 [Immersiella caudata]